MQAASAASMRPIGVANIQPASATNIQPVSAANILSLVGIRSLVWRLPFGSSLPDPFGNCITKGVVHTTKGSCDCHT